jgi:hypothetical protein
MYFKFLKCLFVFLDEFVLNTDSELRLVKLQWGCVDWTRCIFFMKAMLYEYDDNNWYLARLFRSQCLVSLVAFQMHLVKVYCNNMITTFCFTLVKICSSVKLSYFPWIHVLRCSHRIHVFIFLDCINWSLLNNKSSWLLQVYSLVFLPTHVIRLLMD